MSTRNTDNFWFVICAMGERLLEAPLTLVEAYAFSGRVFVVNERPFARPLHVASLCGKALVHGRNAGTSSSVRQRQVANQEIESRLEWVRARSRDCSPGR